MKISLHPERKAAQKAHEEALAVLRKAEMGTDEKAWEAAKSTADKTRMALIEAENKHPTYAEERRASRRIMLKNRGYDVA